MARIWLAAARYYAELEPELFRVPYEEGLAEAFETSIRVNRTDGELQLVAEDDGRLVGMVEARLVEPVENAGIQLVRYVGQRHVIIDSLMVDPTSWRQGIGAELMEAVEGWGRTRGAVLARLDTFADSPVSIPFYERQGYRRRSVIFEKPL
jgi:GNAT superfamily N-acetyltransferase